MSHYDYSKNHYRLIAVDFIKQKEIHADRKTIQDIEFVGQLYNVDGVNADGKQSMFVLTILEKIKVTRLEFSQWKLSSVIKDNESWWGKS